MLIGFVIAGVLLMVITIAAANIFIERRLLGLWQDRHGPNRTGWHGIMQVPADMIKIFTKEDWIPPFADKPVFAELLKRSLEAVSKVEQVNSGEQNSC